MRALLIEFNLSTGKRAGNVNPRDKGLHCNGWQNLKIKPALELRQVLDDRDLSKYKNVSGITIIEGADNINASIDANFEPQYSISDEFLFNEHMKQKFNKNKIDIDALPNDRDERIKLLKESHGIKGITKKERQKV